MMESAELAAHIATASRGRGQAFSFNALALVDVVESGAFLPYPERTASEVDTFVRAILAAQPEFDVFTLSSTHLPWLDTYFRRLFPGKAFVDPVRASIEALVPLTTTGCGRVVYAVTESPAHTASAFRSMLAAMRVDLHPIGSAMKSRSLLASALSDHVCRVSPGSAVTHQSVNKATKVGTS